MANGLFDFVNNNKGAVAAGAGVATLATVGGVALAVRSRKKRAKKAKRKTRRSSKHYSKRKKRYPHTAGKRKDRSHKRIRFTKRGQPYIIMGNGRAKFIKMSSAKKSRKLKGGRY